MSKISAYGAATIISPNDLLIMVDVDDTTMAATGTDKKATVSQVAPVDWVNAVAQYGADPTGGADATTAIQNAINAAALQGVTSYKGGLVYLPAGYYSLSAALALPANVGLVGDGPVATLLFQNSTTANGITITDGVGNIIRDLNLQGPGSGSGIGIAAVISSAPDTFGLHFQNLRVRLFGGNGLDLYGPITSVFDGVISANHGGHGFNLHSAISCTSCAFISCFAEFCAGNGYNISSMFYSSMISCAADSNTGAAYSLSSCGCVVLNGCGAESNTGDGFVVAAGQGITLLSPSVYKNNHYAVHLTSSTQGALVSGLNEDTPTVSAVNSIITDAGTSSVITNCTTVTAASYGGTVTRTDLAGITTPGGGTSSASSAPVITGIAAASGTAKQLSDLTRDYMVYFTITTAGTATSLSIGHTSAASDVTLKSSVAANLGDVWSFRLPAGWWLKWTGTTTAIGNQVAVGC